MAGDDSASMREDDSAQKPQRQPPAKPVAQRPPAVADLIAEIRKQGELQAARDAEIFRLLEEQRPKPHPLVGNRFQDVSETFRKIGHAVWITIRAGLIVLCLVDSSTWILAALLAISIQLSIISDQQ